MGHLNAERMRKLLQRPADEPELLAHLGEGCEECEAFLAATAHPLLDGTTDVALLALAPEGERPPSSATPEGERTGRRVGAREGAARPTRNPAFAADDERAEATFRRIRPRDLRWLYAVAAVLLAVVALLLLRPEQDSGLKGGPHVAIELQAVVKQGEQLTRVEHGQTVRPNGVLLLRYHASENTTARLQLIRGSAVEALGEVKLESGTHDLTRDGSLVGLSLSGERGQVKMRLEVDSAPSAEIEVNVAP